MACARAIEAASDRCISAANFLEAAIVIDGSRDPIVRRRFDDLLSEAQLVIEPVTEVQARIFVHLPGIRAIGSGSRSNCLLSPSCCSWWSGLGIAFVAGQVVEPDRDRPHGFLVRMVLPPIVAAKPCGR